jgi:hypothetical protein
MALKYGAEAQAPADWKEKLASIAGVASVRGDLPNRAQFTATPAAADTVRERFSASFHVEEIVGRSVDEN